MENGWKYIHVMLFGSYVLVGLVGSKIFSKTLEESIEASMLHSCFYCIKSANNFTITAAKSTKEEIEQCM
jgi:hypothetical protein